ncbi:DNA-binding response regulator [Taibaiella sp. KBW10]|uniref:LytR/AlgR family response regulator transcription factor n=1 Tax=Taibaiella sp. KBW10 TaxID=2153357 RepID=UPI000F5969E5|nr:LytTR family transcriptional regulator DNA-binding domain-containing protein [Taibaiella sp. KBW10]RQO30755.1 DNA-binding response regulator [Taibaiella sp. KBW10]
MLKCLLIDDEPLARSILKEMLQEIEGIEVVGECSNGFEGVKSIQALQPDIVFLDVQMPKINGFEMLELLDEKPNVIFITAFDEYAVQAFEVNAIDYLLKPIEQSRLVKAITKLKNNSHPVKAGDPETEKSIFLPEQMQRIVVKDNGEIKIIPLPQILYLEAADDYVKVQTQDKYYLKYQTMTKFEQQLPPAQFVRVHRSYFVNVSYINKIELLEKEQYCILLKDGQKIPVSKSGYAKLKSFLGI